MRKLIACIAAMLGTAALAQDYPTKPVRILVPFAPGGVADNSARVVAEPLAIRLGQQVIVENRPGASGNIGTQQAAQAAADGYTLLLGFDGTMVINPHVFPKITFDTLGDFAPVTKLGDATLILVAHPSAGVRNLNELIEKAKSKPFPYGTSGTGGTPHLAGELLKQRTGAQLEHVPYKGGGPAVIDVVGGQIPLVFTAIASAQQTRAQRTARCTRRAEREALRRAARRADLPGERPRRLRRELLGRHLRAGENAAGGDCQAAKRTERGAAGPVRARSLCDARHRAGGKHTG
jgi:tripartite-type tricarboxylate transporter receptor subunit TctC